MDCPNCGAEMTERASFCSNCGYHTNMAQPKKASAGSHSSSGVVFITLGWICFGISFFLIPILFAAGAFIFGFLTYRSHSQSHGVILMVMAVVGCVLGMLIGFLAGASSM